MYSDKTENKGRRLIWPLLAALILAVILLSVFRHPKTELEDSGAAAIREAVQRSALQCYVVEGVYPPNLQYLEDNYGLQVNTEDYYVSYEAFASNLPPTVKVVNRTE
ncbi:MAG: hypothetical protein IKS55_04015 [Oscillospiraceae bacterium]|nr:hypothetical protein [Oscillospiraceae bacterium]